HQLGRGPQHDAARQPRAGHHLHPAHRQRPAAGRARGRHRDGFEPRVPLLLGMTIMHRSAALLLGPLAAIAVGLALRSGLALAAEPAVVPEVAEPTAAPTVPVDEPDPE